MVLQKANENKKRSKNIKYPVSQLTTITSSLQFSKPFHLIILNMLLKMQLI